MKDLMCTAGVHLMPKLVTSLPPRDTFSMTRDAAGAARQRSHALAAVANAIGDHGRRLGADSAEVVLRLYGST